MALSRQRKTALIIRVGDMLKRMPADRVIHEVGGSTAGEIFRTEGPEENDFVEQLLDNTIAYTERDLQGNLRIAPR